MLQPNVLHFNDVWMTITYLSLIFKSYLSTGLNVYITYLKTEHMEDMLPFR